MLFTYRLQKMAFLRKQTAQRGLLWLLLRSFQNHESMLVYLLPADTFTTEWTTWNFLILILISTLNKTRQLDEALCHEAFNRKVGLTTVPDYRMKRKNFGSAWSIQQMYYDVNRTTFN